MLSVDDWLRQSGVELATDITNTASAVSADGSIVVGTLRNNKAFVARGASTDPSGPTAGIIAVEDAPAGIMETNWNENRSKLPSEAVRNTIGSFLRPQADGKATLDIPDDVRPLYAESHGLYAYAGGNINIDTLTFNVVRIAHYCRFGCRIMCN